MADQHILDMEPVGTTGANVGALASTAAPLSGTPSGSLGGMVGGGDDPLSGIDAPDTPGDQLKDILDNEDFDELLKDKKPRDVIEDLKDKIAKLKKKFKGKGKRGKGKNKKKGLPFANKGTGKTGRGTPKRRPKPSPLTVVALMTSMVGLGAVVGMTGVVYAPETDLTNSTGLQTTWMPPRTTENVTPLNVITIHEQSTIKGSGTTGSFGTTTEGDVITGGGIRWRSDKRCGPGFLLPWGAPAECDPNSIDFCCSGSGRCGHRYIQCFCSTCIDYRE
ncbi:uncharacterized protein LOC100375355 [Saccoglossus kowalevskii]